VAPPPITAVPVGGLCNRLALLDSVLALGRTLGRPVRLIWLLRPELNARFGDLFEPVPGLTQVVDLRAAGWWGRRRFQLRKVLARLRGTVIWGHRSTERLAAAPEELVERARGVTRGLWIRGDDRVFSAGAPFRGFAPRRDLAQRVAAVEPRLRDAVGVHVRRTDNEAAIRTAPLQAFVDAMRAEQAAEPGCRFFLSTDDPAVRDALTRAFGDAVFHHPHDSFHRNDPRAIEGAVVDVWSLAACRRLIGSPASMFTLVAQQLRGIPCRIVSARG
jgi:hypothetical protein